MSVIALALSLAVVAAQPQPGVCDTVPASVITQADAHALSVANMLVEAGCLVSIEVTRADWMALGTAERRWNPNTLNREQFAQDKRVPAGEFIRLFNTTHNSYIADLQDGIVRFRPFAGGAAYLDRAALEGKLAARGLSIMLATLVAAMEGRVLSGGVAGSFISSGPVDRADDVSFSVEATGRPVSAVLDDVLRQAPPRGWFVIISNERPARVEEVGFIYQWGSTSRMLVAPR